MSKLTETQIEQEPTKDSYTTIHFAIEKGIQTNPEDGKLSHRGFKIYLRYKGVAACQAWDEKTWKDHHYS